MVFGKVGVVWTVLRTGDMQKNILSKVRDVTNHIEL